MNYLTVSLLVLVLSSSSFLRGSDQWPRFRGENGSGISELRGIPDQWSEEDYAWEIDLPGEGNSSPVIWDQRVWVTSADSEEKQFHLQCLDARSGQEIWRYSEALPRYRKHKNNSFASSTPAVDHQHVYALRQFPERSPLTAWSHDGRKAWEIDLGPYRHGQGGATSPIVWRDLVIVANDHGRGSALIAVDARTGKEVWRIPREGQRACYATPCIRTRPDGNDEVVFSHCFEGLLGVDARSGQRRWQIDVFGRFAQRAVGSPIVAGDRVFANSGAAAGEKNLVCIDPTGEVHEVYRVSRGAPHVPTALTLGDRLFLWSDQGIVTSVERETGRKIWQKRVGGNYFASPICISGRLLCPDLDGRITVLSTADDYEVVGRVDLGGETRSTPAVGAGHLILRTVRSVHAIAARSN